MTAIIAASAPILPAAVIASSLARVAAVPDVPTSRADQPAVINDVTSQAASGAGAVSGDDLPATLRGKVNRVLEAVGSHNSFDWLDSTQIGTDSKPSSAKRGWMRAGRSTLASARTMHRK